jgi:large subunit ribosomal protein L18
MQRNKSRLHRKKRIRAKISGTAKRPRLSVFRSLTSLKAQAINDEKGITLVFSDTKKIKAKNSIEGAKKLGKEIAKISLEKGIKEMVFDRSGYKFHGKIKALADGAREGGLKI